ncbi:MAG: hypothetical protein WAZ12_04470 [Candidatus Absconditicoccaceae bacterium]
MFFAVLGKNRDISLEELEFIQPQNIKQLDNFTVTFETFFPEKLNLLGGIIKRGKIVDTDEFDNVLSNTKLLGTQDKALGIDLKKKYKIKRFKITDLLHTDKEVKEKGIEIIKIKSDFGIVKGYQNIPLYEAIDFDKPARDMKMGMMPSKLAHIMLNIGLNNIAGNPTIYDPLSGSGTMGFISNFFGYNFIGSDIKTNYLIQNLERRQSTKFCKNNRFETFQQDIFLPINTQELNLIVITEGRLGPIVTDRTSSEQVQKYQHQVIDTYKELVKRIHEINAVKGVFTIPYYIGYDNKIEQEIQEISTKLGFKFKSVQEIYKRENQKVGRKIIILNK